MPLPCQPICNKNETIKAYNGASPLVNNGYLNSFNISANESYLRRFCLGQTVCVIDNINISIFGGNSQVEFNQVCPGCGEGGCICYLDFSNSSVVDGINGLQNPVVFNQNCPTSLCSKGDIFLPCNPYNNADTGKNSNSNYNHDGQPAPNSTNDNRDKYIFGIQNWLVPILLLSIAILAVLAILIVNIFNINREIYLLKPQSRL